MPTGSVFSAIWPESVSLFFCVPQQCEKIVARVLYLHLSPPRATEVAAKCSSLKEWNFFSLHYWCLKGGRRMYWCPCQEIGSSIYRRSHISCRYTYITTILSVGGVWQGFLPLHLKLLKFQQLNLLIWWQREGCWSYCSKLKRYRSTVQDVWPIC